MLRVATTVPDAQGRPRHRHVHPGGRPRRRGRTRSSRPCSAARPTAAAPACSTTGTSPATSRSATPRGRIVGMLFIGLRQDALEGIRARRGRVAHRRDAARIYVLGGSGNQRGRYLIPPRGRRRRRGRVGGARRARRAVRPGARRAPRWRRAASPPRSRSRAPRRGRPRERVAAATYFAPWDWVIVAEIDREEAVAAAARGAVLARGRVRRHRRGRRPPAAPREHLGGGRGRAPARRAARGDGRRRRADRAGRRAAGGRPTARATRSAGWPRPSAGTIRYIQEVGARRRRDRTRRPLDRASCRAPTRDELTQSFQSAQSELRRLVEEMDRLAHAAVEGRLTERADPAAVPGRLPRGARGGERDALDAGRPPRRDAGAGHDRRAATSTSAT